MVATLNHYMNGITRWVIPIAYAFACIIRHVLDGNKNEATIRGFTRERGDSDARGTETLSSLVVSSANLG